MPPTNGAPQPAHPAPRRNGKVRALFHGSLFMTFMVVGAALFVWPQWLALDGARSALDAQKSREGELTARLDLVRAKHGRLRDWNRSERRVFLAKELTRFPETVREVARREGVTVVRAVVTGRGGSRWRPMSLPAALDGEGGGEIRPRQVKVVLKGGFDALYRAVATLGQQQQLFVADRWELTPLPTAPGAPKQLKAAIWGTVFLVDEPDGEPAAPPALPRGGTQVAWEGVR